MRRGLFAQSLAICRYLAYMLTVSMRSLQTNLPFFRDYNIAAIATAPHPESWSVTVENTGFDIRLHAYRHFGLGTLTHVFRFGRLGEGGHESCWSEYFKKSFKRFRVKILDLARA